MFRRTIIAIVFTIIFLYAKTGGAQDYKLIDSLRKVIPTKSDTDATKAMMLSSLAFHYSYIDLDSGMKIAVEGLKISNALNHARSKATTLNTIGTIYHDQANYKKAIESFTEARKNAELVNDTDMLGVIYANAGNTHNMLGDFPNARKYLFESVKIFKQLNQAKRLTPGYLNIGSMYLQHKMYDSALYYFNHALTFPTNNKGSIASAHVSKSYCYRQMKQYELAEKECLQAIEIAKELKSDYYYYEYASELGSIYLETKKYDKAEPLLLQSLEYAHKGSLLQSELSNNLKLFQLYQAKKQYAKALDYHLQYFVLNDSINNAETNKAARELEKKYQNEKKEAVIEKLNAENHAQETEVKRQNQLLIFAIIGFILLLIAFGFAIYAFINKKKANNELKTLHKEVSIQKNELFDKNKSITDSIQYAHRIQKALLTSHSYIKANMNDFFIVYKPKDIVSGDFYWALKNEDEFYFMLADCTGHGVPGAFMSLLGISFLNEILQELKLKETNEIINKLRTDIINALTDDNTENYQMKDGMDGVLCRFDFKAMKLQYTAANNKIVIVRNGATIDLRGDKMPIGRSPKEEQLFTAYEFDLIKGDLVYLFTDGFPDQFGGEKGKKLKEKKLKEFLLQNSGLPLPEQESNLIDYLEKWRGDLEQIDDICLVGFKI
jgi:serine phosphatase RsbU (regulator of sigma subunit)